MPLFSPVCTSTRPYSQTCSSTQWDLMQPDEVLRLDRRKCIVLFQGRKPALLYKLAPEELPDYGGLRSRKVIDYMPEWKRQEEKAAAARKSAAPPESVQQPEASGRPVQVNPAEDLDYLVELTNGSVCGEDDSSPPGR